MLEKGNLADMALIKPFIKKLTKKNNCSIIIINKGTPFLYRLKLVMAAQ